MDFCICLQIGCSSQISQEGDGKAYQCPRCHNPSVFAVKETKCLEICCVPLVPMGSSHLWQCNICQWTASQDGPPPPPAMMGGPPPQQFNQGYAPQQGMGYGGGGYPQQPQQPQQYGH
ncbi:hypothetical protein T439DRAFT_327201 [Meredithblackwellia eburnea MCA 4105]